MKELFRSNEMVFLSWVEAVLRSEDIEIVVLDGNMSAEGSVGAISRRVMVSDEDYSRACRLPEDAGEETACLTMPPPRRHPSSARTLFSTAP